MRDPSLAIPVNMLLVSGTVVSLWIGLSYLPGQVEKYAHSQAFANDLSCIWDYANHVGRDCTLSYNKISNCMTSCAGSKIFDIPLTSLTNTSLFTEALVPVTKIAETACNMTDPIGISEFVETSRKVFTAFVNRGNGGEYSTYLMACNNRLHLFVGYWGSYIYDTYISTEGASFYYTPDCMANALKHSSPYVGYQIANTLALVICVSFFCLSNYIGWM